MVLRAFSPARQGDDLGSLAQRPGNGGGGDGDGGVGRGAAGRGDAVRPRRADGQRGPGDDRQQSAISGHRHRPGFLQPAGGRCNGGAADGHGCLLSPAIRRRIRIHRLFRLTPGCNPQGNAQAQPGRRRIRRHLEGALPSRGPPGPGAEIPKPHPHQLPVRQGRRGVGARTGIRAGATQGNASGNRRRGAGIFRQGQGGAYRRGSAQNLHGRVR